MTRPDSLRVVRAVARVTFTEILRDKILYNVLLCALLLFGIGFLASQMTFVRPERVVLDFGLSIVIISCSAIGILIGAGLIGREFERRTIHLSLSRPISRAQFVTGKFCGIGAVVTSHWFLVSVSYLVILSCLQGPSETLSSGILWVALLLALVQGWVMAAVTMFFSTFSTTSLSVVMAVGAYLIGENISQLRAMIGHVSSHGLREVLGALACLPPDLEYFNLGLRVTYGIPAGLGPVLWGLGYGLLVMASMMIAAGIAIRWKDV